MTVAFTGDEWLPVKRDGDDYLLRYTFVPSRFVGAPEEHVHRKNGRILVGISRTLAAVWGLQSRDHLRQVLFEHARRHMGELAREGSLSERAEIQLTTANSPSECPYDPQRVALSFNQPHEYAVPDRHPVAGAEPTALAAQIVDLRDSINALFGETHGGRLLTLPQERHLVELHKGCHDQVTFAYLAASLGGLATALSADDLRRAIKKSSQSRSVKRVHRKQDSELKSLDLLGRFLEVAYPGARPNEILDALQNLNRLRRMYPIHTDRATGVLEAHRFFGLEYPVHDHRRAGLVLIERYRDTLTRLLDVLKTESAV